MRKTMKKFLKDESGASLIEYVLIAGLISIAGYIAMKTIGGDMGSILDKTATHTTEANGLVK